MSIEQLEQCHHSLLNGSWKPLELHAIATIQEILANRDNPQWQAQLIEFEKLKIAGQESGPLFYACISRLEHSANNYRKWPGEYQLIKSLFQHLMKTLPFKMLNDPHQRFGWPIFKPDNAFSLALNHLTDLYRIFVKGDGSLPTSLFDEWFNDIFQPMMAHTPIFNVDVGGNMIGDSNLVLAWQVNIPRAYTPDPLTVVANHILAHTKKLNEPNTSGQNVLFYCIQRKVPSEFIEPLIIAGADIHTKCRKENFGGGGNVRASLLSHCMTFKHYDALRLLLKHGADPNAQPEREQFYLKDNRENLPELTPYQLAVAMEDEQAIEIFITHANNTGIPLVTTMEEDATSWRNNLGNLDLKKHGDGLVLSCKHRLFQAQNNLLDDIYQEFGIRCYVANPNDRENVRTALRWLATDAHHSPLGKIWQPIYRCMIEQMQTGKKIALYVSSIPRDITKQESCGGLTHENIYAQSGLSVDRYKSVIAHEAAHLFDQVNIHINQGRFQWGEKGEAFASAIEQDLQALDFGTSSSFIGTTASEIKSVYKDKYQTEPFKEYFAYFLCSIPFDDYLRSPETYCEQRIFEELQKNLPRTFDWFRQEFLSVNCKESSDKVRKL